MIAKRQLVSNGTVIFIYLVCSLVILRSPTQIYGHTANEDWYCGSDDRSTNHEATCQQQEQQEKEDISSPSWKWNLDDSHPCNVIDMEYGEFLNKFGPKGLPPLYHQPIVIRHDKSRNKQFLQQTSLENISKFFPNDFKVTLSSSNSFSEHRRIIPLKQYLDEVISSETTPDILSNETWYLFGETFSNDWITFMKSYELPLCHTCTRDLTALSFGIGNKGSGVQWHIHGPGFSQALHGRKHWILYPPNDKPSYHPDYTSRYWMEYTYFELPISKRPYECTLNEGDIIYFPDRWYHATLNLDGYTAFISAFTTEH